MKNILNKKLIERYSRQIVLKDIGPSGQKKILKSKVKICPSILLIAPTIKIFLYFIEYLFNRNLVLKLSDPSTIKS